MQAYLEKHGHLFITLAAIIGAFAALVAIMGQHFDAQDQRFDAQERLNGQFFQLVNQRLDAQDQRMDERFEQINQRFDAHEKLMNERFEHVYQRLDAQGKRLDRLTDEVAELRGLMVSITERVSRNEGEIAVIRDHLRIADTPSP